MTQASTPEPLPIPLTSVQKLRALLERLDASQVLDMIGGAGDPMLTGVARGVVPMYLPKLAGMVPEDPAELDELIHRALAFLSWLLSDPEPNADHVAAAD